MKTIVVSLLLFLCIFGADSSQARKPDEFHGDSPNPFVFSCFNFGAGVSPSFTSCVNSNFKAFESRTDAFFLTCLNVSQEVDYSFVSCISSNFRSLSRALRGNVYLSECYNFDRSRLESSFVSCVNSNFSTADYFLSLP